jgi:hypothetical protein
MEFFAVVPGGEPFKLRLPPWSEFSEFSAQGSYEPFPTWWRRQVRL